MPTSLPTAASLYDRVQRVIPPIEWPAFASDIDAILELKRQRNAVILAHNYQTPEIFHCVADIVGDSLALARKAMSTEADVIVLARVHFMAETAKLLNPKKTVLIPDLRAGCSLADRRGYPYKDPSTEDQAFLLISVNVEHFRAIEEFTGELERFVSYVKDVPLETGAKSVRMPGEGALIGSSGKDPRGILVRPHVLRRIRDAVRGFPLVLPPSMQ